MVHNTIKRTKIKGHEYYCYIFNTFIDINKYTELIKNAINSIGLEFIAYTDNAEIEMEPCFTYEITKCGYSLLLICVLSFSMVSKDKKYEYDFISSISKNQYNNFHFMYDHLIIAEINRAKGYCKTSNKSTDGLIDNITNALYDPMLSTFKEDWQIFFDTIIKEESV